MKPSGNPRRLFVLIKIVCSSGVEDKQLDESKCYIIYSGGKPVKVSKAVYHVYHKEREHEKYINKKALKVELSLERMKEEGVNVEKKIHSCNASVEELYLKSEQLRELNKCIAKLTNDERKLIKAIFYDDLSEKQLAAWLDVSQQAINKRKKRILMKMKKMMS